MEAGLNMADEIDAPIDGEMIRSEVTRLLADRDGAAVLRDLLAQGGLDKTLWAQFTELGWLAISAAASEGGLELGLEARAIVCEELGRSLAAIPFTVTATALAALSRADDASLRRLAGEWTAEGQVVTLALLDVQAPGAASLGFDAGRLWGASPMTVAAQYAGHALVGARDVGGAAHVLLVDLSGSAVQRQACRTIDDSRGYADLTFDGAPAVRVGGADLAEALLDEVALLTAMEQIGGAAACLDMSRSYALERWAFGRPIGANQSVKHQLADMYVQLQLARGAAAAALRNGDVPGRRMTAAARLAASAAYDLCAQEAIQLHGALGVTWEAPMHLHYRRARCHALELGGPLVWRRRLVAAALEDFAQ